MQLQRGNDQLNAFETIQTGFLSPGRSLETGGRSLTPHLRTGKHRPGSRPGDWDYLPKCRREHVETETEADHGLPVSHITA